MNEYKFRAWDKHNNVMIYSDEINEENFNEYDFKCDENGNLVCFVVLDHDDWVDWIKLDNLMQYTGLNDKNGKESYDLDIVKFAFDGYEREKVIFYHKENKYWAVCDLEDYGFRNDIDYHEMLFVYKDDKFEIIGNISENKELAEVKE